MLSLKDLRKFVEHCFNPVNVLQNLAQRFELKAPFLYRRILGILCERAAGVAAAVQTGAGLVVHTEGR
jgi:hypothetical protein